jgi:hypothetical protein
MKKKATELIEFGCKNKKTGLISGKKYNHPEIGENMYFSHEIDDCLYFRGFVVKKDFIDFNLFEEVREKIKATCDAWIAVGKTEKPSKDCIYDKVFNVYTTAEIYLLKEIAESRLINERFELIKLKATFEEVDDE